MSLESQFQQIYNDNYYKVSSLCLGYVKGDRDAANDLTQEVFIKIWENLKSFRNESKISTWIYRITSNTCLLYLKKAKTLPLKAAIEIDESDEAKAKENQFRQMYRCIDLLPDQSKSIILLELEDLPQTEIAKILGLSHEAIRTRIYRIKKELSKCVQNEKF